MAILSLAWKSLLNRRSTALLAVLSIALSVTLLLGVERLRTEARLGFANTLSGTDLIIGARSGAIQLLLYSVFHLGDATNNFSWESYRHFAAHPKVAWSVPLSLGDSHRGFRVIGTTQGFFQHFRYARQRSLSLSQGRLFTDLYDVVIGAEVARKLDYRLGQSLVIAHGASDVSFARHEDQPFSLVGILQPTRTPVDRSVLVSLQAIEAIHANWQGGVYLPANGLTAQQARSQDLTPKAITAALLGLKSKIAIFRVQRDINEYPAEPLSAILPGAALSRLWSMIGIAENALLLVSMFVVVVGLFGMLSALLTSLNERRREMAILRSVGARPGHIFVLFVGEALLLSLLGILLGGGLLYAVLFGAQPLIEQQLGIFIGIGAPSMHELKLLLAVLVAGVLAGVLPAYRAYRLSLADGLAMRI